MDPLRIPGSPQALSWEYDEEADVLYITVGSVRPALSVDLGEGVVARYDEGEKELVGLTVIGLRARLLAGLSLKETA